MNATPIRLVIADDHPMYLEGVAGALARDERFEVAGVVSDGDAAIRAIAELRPDVAVIDLRMPGRDGLAALIQVRAATPEIPVMLLTADASSGAVYAGIAAGARGFVSKDSSAGEICDAVAAIAAGGTILSRELHTGLAEQIRLRAEGDSRPRLSPRELDVLRLAAEGLSVNAMAKRLFLGDATIKSHLKTAYEKLEVSDRAAAVAAAIRGGLLE